MNRGNQKVLGLIFGISAGAMWAAETILGKVLLASLSFLQVAASETFFAMIVAVIYALFNGELLRLKRFSLRDALFIGLVGSVLAPLAYFLGLSWTLAINAALLAHLQPIFVSILGFLFLNEKIWRNDVVGGLMIGLAAVLITSRTFENLAALKFGNLGDAVVLLATLGWAIVTVPGKRLTKAVSSVVIVSFRFMFASAIFLPLSIALNQLAIESIYQVVLGIIAGLGYIFYYEGLKRIKTSQVALTELSSPFFTAVLAWFILGERLTLMQIAGAILLLTGLIVLARKEKEQS
ncbi:DMT family transporter [Candidatus Bathyarchaeota archaeon]|nr:DMT family transporter [Candidatus Bathyarchaeota archaeon]